MSVKASAGGAAGAGGVGFEGRTFAWLAAHLLSDSSLPTAWGNTSLLSRIGTQTGFAVDDIGALHVDGGCHLLQGKKGLGLGEADNSPLAEAVAQVVHAARQGIVPADVSGPRPVNTDRDVLVILTDATSRPNVKKALADIVDRLSHHPDSNPLLEAPTTEPERTALTVLLTHIRRAWNSEAGAEPTEQQIRSVLKVLRVCVLELDEGQSDRATAEVLLGSLLVDRQQRAGAFRVLSELGQQLAELRQWRDATEIRNHLRNSGFALVDDPRVSADITRLQARSAAFLKSDLDRNSIPTPDGPLTLHRDLADTLLTIDDNVALIGEPGTGKTGVAASVANTWTAAGQSVVYLPASVLAGDAAQAQRALDLDHSLLSVLSGWEVTAPATLVVDGLDNLRLAEPSAWLRTLLTSLTDTPWRIIATVRMFDLRHSPGWQEIFPGEPPKTDQAAADLRHVRHLLIGDLSNDELAPALQAHPGLATLATASPSIAKLIHNPYNLYLAASLPLDPDTQTALGPGASRLDLLNAYWQRRVTGTADHRGRVRVLTNIARFMLSQHSLRIADQAVPIDDGDTSSLDGLLSDGILREEGGVASAGTIAFAHTVLFDYSVARLLFDHAQQTALDRELDQDPSLSLLVRPSIDMRLAQQWRSEAHRKNYWHQALRLGAPGKHPIAAAAAAATAIAHAPTGDDLETLAQACVTGNDDQIWTARTFVSHHLGAALTATAARPARIAAVPSIAALAQRLAGSAEHDDDPGLARVAVILLNRAAAVDPLWVRLEMSDDLQRRLRRLLGFPLTRRTSAHPPDPLPASTRPRGLESGVTQLKPHPIRCLPCRSSGPG